MLLKPGIQNEKNKNKNNIIVVSIIEHFNVIRHFNELNFEQRQ